MSKDSFLIRRVLFIEFNEQIRRWLSSSSSSPFDDRYHFGSTLRYNREAFYFILFFFLPFFSILFLLSGEKNGWKPLSAIVGIWTDSWTPLKGGGGRPVSRTVTGNNSRQVRFAVLENGKINGQTLVFPCKFFTIPTLPISMVQTSGRAQVGRREGNCSFIPR